jgi:hypothetical protein
MLLFLLLRAELGALLIAAAFQGHISPSSLLLVGSSSSSSSSSTTTTTRSY